MTVKEVIDKTMIGISPLTGIIYVYYPDSDGSAKYKKIVTSSKEESVRLLKEWLEFLQGGQE